MGEVLEATKGRLIGGDGGGYFSGIILDSRISSPGNLFIPLSGKRFDGHDFIPQAMEKGALGFLSSIRDGNQLRDGVGKGGTMIEVEDTLVALGDLAHFFRNKYPIPLAAITGSNGKTTTKEILAEILKIKFKILKTEGNFNNLVGLPLTLLKLRKEDEVVVLEMGMNQPGEIKRLAEISEPNIGLITNITMSHLEKLTSLEEVAAAKGELFESLGEDDFIVVNGDDPNVLKLAKKNRSRQICFGIESPADLMAKDISFCGLKGSRFRLSIRGEEIEISLNSYGVHNIYNALAAAAVGVALQIDPSTIKEGLENFKPYPMRTELFRLKGGIVLIDDTYNANPKSMEAALRTLVELKGKNRGIAILGDMLELGDYTSKAHDKLGSLVQDLSVDYLFIFGKFSKSVYSGAMGRGMGKDSIFASEDMEEIISRLKRMIRSNDRILVKGSRAMKMERIVEKIILRFGIER